MQRSRGMWFAAQWLLRVVVDREVSGSNPGGGKVFAPIKKNWSGLQPLNYIAWPVVQEQFFRHLSVFFGNGFPNSLIVRFSSSFCLVNENSLNCTPGLVLLCFFYLVVKILFTTIWRHIQFKSAFSWFVHAIPTELRVWRHFLLLVERMNVCHSKWMLFESS